VAKKTGIDFKIIVVIVALAILIYPNFTKQDSNPITQTSEALLSRIELSWARIPLLGQFEFAQIFFAILIIIFIYKALYD